MTKKLILLTLALPLVLMICLFALTKTVGQAIDAPVTGIEIVGEKTVYLDLDKQENHTIEYTIFPTSAKNRQITVKTERVGESMLATFDTETLEDGRLLLVPTASGAARVTLTTVDGAYKDSIIVYVETSLLTGITSSVDKHTISVGERLDIHTVFTPSTAENIALSYTSSNPAVVSILESGCIVGVGAGKASVTVRSLWNANIFSTLEITVENADVMDLIEDKVSSTKPNGKVQISMDTTSTVSPSQFTYQVLRADGTPYEESPLSALFTVEGKNVTLDYSFLDSDFVGEVILRITYAEDGREPITKDCTVTRVEPSDFTVSFDTKKVSVYVGQNDLLTYTATPADVKLTLVNIATSNENVSVINNGGMLIIKGERAGLCTVTLTLRAEDGTEKSFSHDILALPKSLSIAEQAGTYGDEGLFVVGGEYPDGSVQREKLTVSASGTLGENFYDNFAFESDSDKVYVDGDGVICFNDSTFSGLVKFCAVMQNGDFVYKSAPFEVMCIAEGVNVYPYLDLLSATEEKRVVVLHTDIKDDFGTREGEVVYEEIESTYDKQYYINISRPELAKVKVLLSFYADIYGNGHTINAHNVAYGLDSTGALKNDALFRGPLNFVAMTETGTGGAISVKAQDNICFAVYEGVSVRNVKLRGCDLAADEDGKLDLADLTYTGTTVEVLGDNVDICYSRISNGRTTLRAFGDANDTTKVIHLNIQNSVLSGAREFIMRLGSNCFETGNFDNPAPYLENDGASKNDYLTKEKYNTLSDGEKEAYDSTYIKTFVTLKNSVLEHAGLFAVGMDSHFAGVALADGTNEAILKYSPSFQELLAAWHDLAKTSYGAKLTLEGDVRMYTYKKLDEIDSSTLIEVIGETSFGDKMKFDIKEMIQKLASNPSFSNITFGDNADEMYVHAGIAFFGGGKNYSIVENRLSGTSASWNFAGYSISFEDVERQYLSLAAGNEDFYFLLYDRLSGFSPEDQAEILKTDGAYDCIKNQ